MSARAPSPKRKRGPKPLGKVTVQLRLKEATRDELLRVARASNQSPNQYVEEVLQRDFARQRKIGGGRVNTKIPTKPDFRKHFAKHPPVAGGDEVLKSLLQEREESL